MRKGLVLAVLLVPTLLLAAETQTVSPQEIVSLLHGGKKIKVVLKTGAYAEGRLEELSPAALKVNVSKSHDLRELPTGMQELSLDRVASVSIRVGKGGKRWKLPLILCSTAGTLSLLAAGGSEELQSTYVPAAIAFTAGLGVAGYFAGKAIDERWVTYVLK
jgi:hypothetical protein